MSVDEIAVTTCTCTNATPTIAPVMQVSGGSNSLRSEIPGEMLAKVPPLTMSNVCGMPPWAALKFNESRMSCNLNNLVTCTCSSLTSLFSELDHFDGNTLSVRERARDGSQVATILVDALRETRACDRMRSRTVRHRFELRVTCKRTSTLFKCTLYWNYTRARHFLTWNTEFTHLTLQREADTEVVFNEIAVTLQKLNVVPWKEDTVINNTLFDSTHLVKVRD